MKNESVVGNSLFQVVKGTGVSLLFSLLFFVVFASILQCTSLQDKWIYPVNQTLKIISLCLGVSLCVKGEKGLLKGAVIGVLYTTLSYLTFSAIGGDFSLSWMIFIELALCVFAGILFGIIAVNVNAR